MNNYAPSLHGIDTLEMPNSLNEISTTYGAQKSFRMKTVDICTFNGEHDLWDIHNNVLKDYVDEFIVVEFDTTFSGKPKQRTFKGEYDKVTYHFCTEDVWGKYLALAETSPNTIGASHWKTEFAQKEALKEYLAHLDDNDLVYVGDVDEIWTPTPTSDPLKLKLLVYTYYLNNYSSEDFWGTLVARYRDIKDSCLNHLRTNSAKTKLPHGWHFTSMGGHANLKNKLTDSYTEESYATATVLSQLEQRYGKEDFLGRDFTYHIDASEWPQWLKDNREKFIHLLKI